MLQQQPHFTFYTRRQRKMKNMSVRDHLHGASFLDNFLSQSRVSPKFMGSAVSLHCSQGQGSIPCLFGIHSFYMIFPYQRPLLPNGRLLLLSPNQFQKHFFYVIHEKVLQSYNFNFFTICKRVRTDDIIKKVSKRHEYNFISMGAFYDLTAAFVYS